MTKPIDVAVTAINIMDGLDHHNNWDALQQAWEHNGRGFIEFCVWIAEIAEASVKDLDARNPQEFPGVYDYEVSYEIGQQITRYVIATGELPTTKDVLHWTSVEADAFFSQGETK